MKNQYFDSVSEEEMDILSAQLGPEEMFILGYLKGFNRKVMKDWNKKGILDCSIDFD